MKVKTAAETANVLWEPVCVNLGSPEPTVKVRQFSSRVFRERKSAKIWLKPDSFTH